MWIIQSLLLVTRWLIEEVAKLRDTAMGIPLIGGWIRDFLLDLYHTLYGVYDQFTTLAAWFEEVRDKLLDILSWDAILDKIYLYFPFLRDFAGQVWDRVRTFIDTYFPWLYDPELTIWEWMEWRIRELITEDFPGIEWVREKIREFVDTYFPWVFDPELTIWEYVRERVEALIPEDFPTLENIVEWVAERMGDIMLRFLTIAGWPFLRAIESWILSIWEVAEFPYDWTIYDIDRDGVISIAEAKEAIEDYYKGIISLEELNIVLSHREAVSWQRIRAA